MENCRSSIDRDGDWLERNGSLHAIGILRVDTDIGVKSDFGGFGFRVEAILIRGSVWPGVLGVSISIHQVGVGIVSHTTVATKIDCDTGNKLLRSKYWENSSGDGVCALNSLHGSERPARST